MAGFMSPGRPFYRYFLLNNSNLRVRCNFDLVIGTLVILNEGPDTMWFATDWEPSLASSQEGQFPLYAQRSVNMEDIRINYIGMIVASGTSAKVSIIAIPPLDECCLHNRTGLR